MTHCESSTEEHHTLQLVATHRLSFVVACHYLITISIIGFTVVVVVLSNRIVL